MAKADSIPLTDHCATALGQTNLATLCENLITSNLHLANLVAVMAPAARDEMETFVECARHFIDQEFDVIKQIEAIAGMNGGVA